MIRRSDSFIHMTKKACTHIFMCIHENKSIFRKRLKLEHVRQSIIHICDTTHLFTCMMRRIRSFHLCGMMIDVYIHTRGMTHSLSHFHVLPGTLSYIWHWRETELSYTRDNKLFICIRWSRDSDILFIYGYFFTFLYCI